MTGSELDELCKQILRSDDSIRFVGLADKYGKQVAANYRDGLIPYLNQTESEIYSVDAVMRMNSRKEMESRLGKVIYSFTLYEKLKRATIYIGNIDYPVLMTSFDIQSDHDSIILNKIIPIVRAKLFKE
ncbi:MAG TPA: hypothetical protein VE504_06940 [Nitrososphaeraceae archaeon]|jgi:hypothetical protein|nr:hypothetical protein [Nitrososphaeraceae archaeon]